MSEALANPEQNTNTYTARDMVGLMITSFRLSRGGENMQQGLLSFTAENYRDRFGDQSILETALPDMREAAFQTYSRIHGGASEDLAHARTKADTELGYYAGALRQFLKDGNYEWNYVPTTEMATGIITSDFKLLDKFQDPTKVRETGAVRTFSSNLVTYGLLGRASGRGEEEINHTGREEFDAAFETAANIVLHEPERLAYDQPAEGAAVITKIIDAHIAAHPEDGPLVKGVITGTALETYLQPAAA